MRKAFIFALLLCLSISSSAQKSYTKQGNTYVAVSNRQTSTKADSTGLSFKDTDGKTYPIYLSRNGRAYIIRTSKNGNPYRKYLGEEISRAVCKELGREYIEK